MTVEDKSGLESITDFLKVVLWPTVVIILIIIFWQPIKGLIVNSETISVGDLSIKVRNEMPIPSASVKEVLLQVNTTDIEEILYLGDDTSEFNGYAEGALDDAPINKLLRLNLIREVEHPDGSFANNYKVTQLGAETYNFYIELINVLAKQIDNQEQRAL